MPADRSLVVGGLPIGLTHSVRLRRPATAGGTVGWADVEVDGTVESVRLRREMERLLPPAPAKAAE